jgi:hypothetical protein
MRSLLDDSISARFSRKTPGVRPRSLASPFKEGLEVGAAEPDRVRHPDVRQFAVFDQGVDRCSTQAERGCDLSHTQEMFREDLQAAQGRARCDRRGYSGDKDSLFLFAFIRIRWTRPPVPL